MLEIVLTSKKNRRLHFQEEIPLVNFLQPTYQQSPWTSIKSVLVSSKVFEPNSKWIDHHLSTTVHFPSNDHFESNSAPFIIYSDFDDVLSDRDDDASCGDGYVPGSKIEQEESPRNPGMVTLKNATHFDPTIVLLAHLKSNCDRKKMIMNLTVKVERQCLLICVLIMIIMLEIHILKFVLFNKILQVL